MTISEELRFMRITANSGKSGTMLQKLFKNHGGKALATGVLAAWMAVVPAANADDAGFQSVSTPTESSISFRAEQARLDPLYIESHKAKDASLQKHVTVPGVFVARGNDFEDKTEADMRELTHWLLGRAGIDEGSVVTSGQTEAFNTKFYVFIEGKPEIYHFDTVEDGIITDTVAALKEAEQARRFAQSQGFDLTQN